MASDITADKGRVAEAKTSSLIDNVDAYQDTEVRQVISRKDLWKCAIRGCLWKVTLILNVCRGRFCVFDYPGIAKIHGNNRADLAKSLKNHLQFFNASPKLFTFLLGTAVAMEENKEKPSTINVMKVAGMGPTGDR